MKSLNDFPTKEEYREYLAAYYAGQALIGFTANYGTYESKRFAANALECGTQLSKLVVQ